MSDDTSLEGILQRYQDETVNISKELSANLEIAEHFRDLKTDKVAFYNNVRSDGPCKKLVMNLWGTRDRIAKYLKCSPGGITDLLIEAYDNPSDYELVDDAPFKANVIEDVDLSKLPIPKYFPIDGGPYFTSAVVYIETGDGVYNASYHRMMVFEDQDVSVDKKNTMAIRIVKRHLFKVLTEALERGEDGVKVTFAVGLDPVVMLPAAMSVDFGTDEMRFANYLSNKVLGKPLQMARTDGGYPPAPANAEFVFQGRICGNLEKDGDEIEAVGVPEGPFVDITGTKDFERSQAHLIVDRVYHRDDPVFQGLYPSGTEHFMMMGLPRESTMKTSMGKVVNVGDVRLTEGGCMWLHGIVSVDKSAEDDGVKAGHAALDGHKSMKQVVVVDTDIDIFDDMQVQWAIATRVANDGDLHLRPKEKGKKEKGSTLDPTAEDGMTKKLIIDATKPVGDNEKFARYG